MQKVNTLFGEFVEELKSPERKWVGSRNQRILRRGTDF